MRPQNNGSLSFVVPAYELSFLKGYRSRKNKGHLYLEFFGMQWLSKIIPNHINNPDYDNPSVIETGRSGDIDAIKVDDSNIDEAREARYYQF